jgi:hypothetical protein
MLYHVTEKAVDGFMSLHWLLFKLEIVESQYYESSHVIKGLSRIEKRMK